MSDKSDFWSGLGCGLFIFLSAVGIGGCIYLENTSEAKKNLSNSPRGVDKGAGEPHETRQQ